MFCSFKLIVFLYKNGDYGTVSEVAGDMNVMLENAKRYFTPETKQYKVITYVFIFF